MADELITFVFSVVCPDDFPDGCTPFPTVKPQLDNFKNVMKEIRDKLGGDRYEDNNGVDTKLLKLIGLDAYVGPLESDQMPGALTNGTRYGRVIFTGMAAGKNIFTESIKELNDHINAAANNTEKERRKAEAHSKMKLWETKFNYLLHEIFSCSIDGKPPYIAITQQQLEALHPNNYDPQNSPDDFPWNAAWTIFVVLEGTEFKPMGGHGC